MSEILPVSLFFLTFSTLDVQLSVSRKALFSPKRTVQGRQSIQLGECAVSNLTSYKSVKAMLFVYMDISLEKKEWISWNNVSCIM